MTVTEQIMRHIKSLPEDVQVEILEYVEYLEGKTEKAKKEKDEWSDFSLSQAMKGMESEPDLYSIEDIKEKIQ